MDLSSFSNDELLKLRDIKKRSVNLSSLSNDELLKLRDSFTKPTYTKPTYTKPTYTEQNGFKILDTQKNNLNGYLQGKNILDAVDKFENLKKEQGLNTALTPFDSIGQEALNGIFGLKKNYKDELSSAKDTKSQISAINNAVSKYGASKPIFGNNEKENYLNDLSDTLYKAHGSRIVKKGNEYFLREANGKDTPLDDGFLNDFGRITRDNIGSLVGAVLGAKKGGMIKSAIGAGAGSTFDMKNGADYTEQKNIKPLELAQRMGEEALLSLGGDMAIKALTSKPAINTLKGTAKTALNIADKGLAGVGARHILSQNIGGATSALKANLGGDHKFKHALESAKDALGADLDNFVRTDLKTINKTSDKKYIQKGIDIANSAINKTNEMLKGLNVGKADAELLLSALGHENGVKNILDSVANNPKSAQKIAEMSSSLNKSFSDSINEQLAKFETQTPKDSFKNSFNQVKKDYADAKDFLVKNSNYQSDFKDLSDNLATILSDTQNISTRGVFNALNGGGNLENLLNAKNAINEQLGYIMKADFKSSSDFINQKALNEAKSLIDNEINTALKNDENLINLYKTANGDYATMKNVVDSNLMNQISRDGKTSLEALNAMIKSNENINGVTLNEFLGSLGAKDRAIAEANIIKNLMDKNSVNGIVDFRALNQSLNSLDFGSDFAKELKSQILSKQSILNNTSDILNSLGDRVIKPKTMSQGVTNDPLKRGETMRANFIVEKLKPLIPRLGNNEALKLHLNKAILNANGDFKLAIKNIDDIPGGNLPTPTRNLLNEFKNAVKEIEKQVVKTDNQAINQVNLVKRAATKSQEPTANLAQNPMKGDGAVSEIDAINLVKNISLNKDIAIQLQPKADLLKLVKDFSNVIKTPIFESKISIDKLLNHLADKTDADKRLEYLNLIKPALENPLFIIRENNRYRFVKTFIDSDKITKFLSVIENDKGEFIGITATPIKNTDLKNLLKGNIVWGGDILSTLSTPQIAKQEVEAISETIPNQSIKQAENQVNLVKRAAKELTATKSQDPTQDAPSELYKAHRKAQKAKETKEPKANLAQTTAKTAEPKTEPISEAPKPTTQAKQETQATKEADIKADKKAEREKEQAKIKAYVEGLERDAINKIEALNNFTKAKAETIPLKSIRLQAEQELKEFAKSIGTSEEKLNNFKIKSLDDLKDQLDGLAMYFNKTKDKKAQAILNKYIKILDDMADARFNQRAVKKQNETQKDDLIKGVVDSLKGLQIVGLRNLSNFLTKYGKTDEFMTKANLKWKSEFDKARALMERDQNITPIKEFGTNYAEFYHDGANAIKKLLTEKQGQVAGAFYKEGLGDIDVVWGNKEIGLNKIIEKHSKDFESFGGVEKGLAEIIEKGKNINENGVDTIWYKKGDDYYAVGLSKGFKNQGDNSWVITAYEKKNLSDSQKLKIDKLLNGGDSKTISAYAEIKSSKTPELTTAKNSTPKEIKSQALSVEQKAEQYAKWLSQASKMPPQASDELYKAYDKAKRT